MIVALGIQIGTNYANDYSDGVRGTDAARVGPVRLVAVRASPRRRDVKAASFFAFGVAGVAGLVLALADDALAVRRRGGLLRGRLVLLGRVHAPTATPGYGGVFVFVFFGLVAVVGTAYVNLGHITALAVTAAIPVGFLATALLVVNNLRDIDTDIAAGKKTLAVRTGAAATRGFYAALVGGAFLLVVVIAFCRPVALIALLAIVPALLPLARVLGGARAAAWSPALAADGVAPARLRGSCSPSGSPCEPRPPGRLRRRPGGTPSGGRRRPSGRSKQTAWPAPATTASCAFGPMACAVALGDRAGTWRRGHPPRRARASRDSRSRSHVGACVPVPRPQRGRQALRPSCRAGRAGRPAPRSGGRRAAPSSQVSTNSRHALSPPPLELGGEAARRPRGAAGCLGSSEMPGCAPTTTRTRDEVGLLEGQVQAAPAAEGIADVGGRTASSGRAPRPPRQGPIAGCGHGRAPVAGELDRHDLEVGPRARRHRRAPTSRPSG